MKMKILKIEKDRYDWVASKILPVLGVFAFWVDAVITMVLTPVWIHRCWRLLLRESNLKSATFLPCCFLAATNSMYLGLSVLAFFRNKAPLSKSSSKTTSFDKFLFANRSLLNDVERLAFWNGRFAISMLMLWEVLENPNVPSIQTYAIPCLYLFSFACDMHWIRFVIIQNKVEENEVEPKKGFGEVKLKGKECEMADVDALMGGNTPLKESLGCRDAWLSSEEIKDEVQQQEAIILQEADEEPKEMERMKSRNFMNLKHDEGMPEMEEFVEMVKGDTTSFGYCKAWKEQENCLYSMLSRETTRAEFYCLQARKNEERLRKLKEEKSDLMEKLCAANVKSELYRSLLHDACPNQNCCLHDQPED